MNRQPSIMIVDDDARVLKGLSIFLSKKYNVTEAKDGQTAIKLASKKSIYCVVLDIKMEGINGFKVYEKIKEINNNLPIIFYTAYNSEHNMTDVINKYRPYGYVEKGTPTPILRNLIESAVETYLLHLERENDKKNLKDANLALRVLLKNIDDEKNSFAEVINENLKKLVLPPLNEIILETKNERIRKYVNIVEENIKRVTTPLIGDSAKLYKLSPKEMKVANLIKEGKSSKEIAQIMLISLKTVEFHRRNLRIKLEIKNTKTNLKTYLSTTSL